MKRLSSKIPVLIIVAVLAGVAVASIQDDSTLSPLRDYRQWTKMNSEPVKVETPVSVATDTSVGINTPV